MALEDVDADFCPDVIDSLGPDDSVLDAGVSGAVSEAKRKTVHILPAGHAGWVYMRDSGELA